MTGKEHEDATLANDAVMEIYVLRSEVNDGVIEFQNSVIDLSGASSEKESDKIRVDEVITEISDVTREEKDGGRRKGNNRDFWPDDFLTMTMGHNHDVTPMCFR